MADNRKRPPAGWRELSDDDLIHLAMKPLLKANMGEAAWYAEDSAEWSAGQRALHATCLCDWDVDNGGFHQFFGNYTGVIAPQAIEGFRLFGMEESAKAVENAIALTGLTPYPTDRDERSERIPEYEAHKDNWYALNDVFYGANMQLERHQAAYIRTHPDEFFLP